MNYGVPFIDKLKDDKSIFIMKFDGERNSKQYTFIIQGEKLGKENIIRIDTGDIEEGLAYVFVEYAKIVWDITI